MVELDGQPQEGLTHCNILGSARPEEAGVTVGPVRKNRTRRRGTGWVICCLRGGSTRLNMNGFVCSG